VLDIQRLFSLLVHSPVVAWTSPRTPSDAVLDVIANYGIRDVSFNQYVHVSPSVPALQISIHQVTYMAQY
jgi:hypothetical protein